MEYSSEGKVTRIAGPGIGDLSIGYNASGKVPVSLASPSGKWSITLDEQGRAQSETLADGTVVSYQWASWGISGVEYARPGVSAEGRYGADGILSSRTMDGQISEYRYTPQGLPAGTTDSSGKTQYGYEPDGGINSIRQADGETRRIERAREGEIDRITRPPKGPGSSLHIPASDIPSMSPSVI
jgi:YD repeat-containing protein